MKRVITLSEDVSMMNRSELIDYIDNEYNRDMASGTKLENIIEFMIGHEIDDSGPEGIYSDLSTSQLRDIVKKMEQSYNDSLESFDFSPAELEFIRTYASLVANGLSTAKLNSYGYDNKLVAEKILDKIGE